MNVFHITTVHKRFDVRIFLKEVATLSQKYDTILVVADGFGVEEKNGVRILDLGKPKKNRLIRTLVNYIRIVSFCRGESVSDSVLHFHDPENLPLALWLSFRGFRVIWDSHEDFPRQFLHKHWIPVWFRKPLSRMIENIENFIVKRLSGVVAATPFIEQRFVKLNPNTVCVRNYPILEEFLKISIEKPPGKKFCYIGSITRERGIIQTLDVLLKLGESYCLILCGIFESVDLENEVKSHSAWRQVDFRGFVNRSEVQAVLSVSNVGMVTLHPNPNQIDALPVKLFEYMAAGVPVIASDFPLWREIVEGASCGSLVDPLNVEEIAQAVDAIVQNPELRLELARSGRKSAQESYDWNSEANRLIEFYGTIINKGPV